MDLSGLAYGQVACCCEHGNEPSGSINARNYVTILGTVSSEEELCFMQLDMWMWGNGVRSQA